MAGHTPMAASWGSGLTPAAAPGPRPSGAQLPKDDDRPGTRDTHAALTGATGFLGLRLVRELLRRHGMVTVLARAGASDALERITRFFKLTGTPDEAIADLSRRLRVVEIELGQPRLGLTRSGFQALADGLDVIWHCAADIRTTGEVAELRHVNVEGTRTVMELAAAGERHPLFCHVSTAYVAGARRSGTVYEDELDDARGFDNAYQRTKYEAEVLVHRWSADHGRPAVVLRPGLMVSDLPPHPGLPVQPVQMTHQLLEVFRRRLGAAEPDRASAQRETVRVVGHPRAHLNLMPVEYAAAVMARLEGGVRTGGVETYHVVHDHDVAVSVLIDVFEQLAPMKVELVDTAPADPSALERTFMAYSGAIPLLSDRVRFDDTQARMRLRDRPPGIHIDRAYLLSVLRKLEAAAA